MLVPHAYLRMKCVKYSEIYLFFVISQWELRVCKLGDEEYSGIKFNNLEVQCQLKMPLYWCCNEINFDPYFRIFGVGYWEVMFF
jgi:hypothetical protein